MQAAAAAAGGQQYPAATLYVVATPIGNLADLSFRAAHVLGLVDAVACEDTRVSAGLLRHLGLHKPLVAVHQHNEHEGSAALVARLQAGERIADLVDPISGASTPINSPVDGLFFARENRRFAVAGMSLGKVVGREALRQGKLLSA